MELDKNFKDCLVGLASAAVRKDIEDVHECTDYLARRLEGHGEHGCADGLRWVWFGATNDAWPLRHWEDAWCDLDDDDRLYSVYDTERLAEVRDVWEPPSVLTPEQRTMVKEILCVAKSRLQQDEPLPTCVFTSGTAIQEPFDLALYIAGELGIECFLVEFRDEIKSRARPWSEQLDWLREFATEIPGVLVLRNVERICNSALVYDGWRVEELKCVRESFLNDLLELESPTVVVACTNLEMRLDAGAWERFDYRMELNVAEPDPGLMVFRSISLGDPEGFRKAVASLPAKDKRSIPST